MDEYLNHFLSSSPWSYVNAKERSSWMNPNERSSWICGEPGQANDLLPNPLGAYEGDEEISVVGLMSSRRNVKNLASQDSSSIVPGGEPDDVLDKNLLMGESQPQEDDRNHEGNPPVNGVVNASSKVGYMGLHLKTAISTPSLENLGSSKLFPVLNNGWARLPLSLRESSDVGLNGSEPSPFQRPLRDFRTLPTLPQLWAPPPYAAVSSLSPVVGEDKILGFGTLGEYVEDEVDASRNRHVGNDKIQQLDNLSASLLVKGKEEIQNYPLPSFVAVPQKAMTTAGLQSLPQNTSAPLSGGCNGTIKPRVRARRGQATDPHSIAERLRREKIAERMKNLQELVPNSNKTDKASMLDEIIDYVKFLQLQVKVLSMSRLGAAGAVVPLITDGQAEGSNGLLLSPPADQGADMSSEHIAFEQEVLKLMESNVTMALQCLQSKGLCLMPTALAAALCGGKSPSSGPDYEEREKFVLADNFIPDNNSLPGVGNLQMSFDVNTVIGKLGKGDIKANGCNGAVSRQEEVK